MSTPGSTADLDEVKTTAKRRAIVQSDDEGDEAGPSDSPKVEKQTKKVEEEKSDDENDDLFGNEEAADDDDEDDEDAIKPSGRTRRKVDSASPAPLSRERSRSASGSSQGLVDPRELRELSAEAPMGYRDGVEETQRDVQEASFSLPSLPVRRGAAHFYARLPNMLQYRAEAFDIESFDEKLEDEMLQNREGIRIDDEGLRSLLTTSNTIRWRWSNKRDSNGVRKPESNARIVRWSDGTSSLQLGSEFYDITTTSERIQNKTSSQPQSQPQSSQSQQATVAPSASIVPQQPIQHLTHLFVKHDGQDQVNMFQAEAPIVGSMTFRPTSISSESHQRLAKAVRQQRGTLVKETVTKEDPELVKIRAEKEEKFKRQARLREQRKIRAAKGGGDEEDDDAFWASAGRTVRKHGAPGAGRAGATSSQAALDADLEIADDVDGAIIDDDDGFVVDDEDGEDAEGEGDDGDGEGDMEVDEPDEMDRMEEEMEKQEALRLANKASNGATTTSSDAPVGADSEAIMTGDAGGASARRRRIVDSDDED
jgi:RNA polymerase-associated protein LEO1